MFCRAIVTSLLRNVLIEDYPIRKIKHARQRVLRSLHHSLANIDQLWPKLRGLQLLEQSLRFFVQGFWSIWARTQIMG